MKGVGMWRRIGCGLCLALVGLCPSFSQESISQAEASQPMQTDEYLKESLVDLQRIFRALETNSGTMKRPVGSLSFSLPELSRSWRETSQRLEMLSGSFGRIERISSDLDTSSQRLEGSLMGLQADLSGIRSVLLSVSGMLQRSEESTQKMRSLLDAAARESGKLRNDVESTFRRQRIEVWILWGLVGMLVVERVRSLL